MGRVVEENDDIYKSRVQRQDFFLGSLGAAVTYAGYFPCEVLDISADKTRVTIEYGGKWLWTVPAANIK